MRSFLSAWIPSRWMRSVFTTAVRAPATPILCRRPTLFPPAPPQPTIRTLGFGQVTLASHPVAFAVPIPFPAATVRRGVHPVPPHRRGPTRSLALGLLDRPGDPPPHVLPHRVPNCVLDADGIALLHEVLELDDVPLREFDRQLPDVVGRELLVHEPVDCRADRVGDRVELPLFHQLVELLDRLGWDPDRHTFAF